jgi:hypothetical protein
VNKGQDGMLVPEKNPILINVSPQSSKEPSPVASTSKGAETSVTEKPRTSSKGKSIKEKQINSEPVNEISEEDDSDSEMPDKVEASTKSVSVRCTVLQF